MSMSSIDRERVARVARVYGNNTEASRALGIARSSFSRLCRQYGIETPYKRNLRRLQEARGKGRI